MKVSLTHMSRASALLNQVLAAAQAAGMDQASLARAAGLAQETISRAKKRGTIDLASLEALANVSGLTLGLIPQKKSAAVQPMEQPARSPLADPKWGLAWSNSAITNESLIRNALAKGSLLAILEAVKGHGYPEVLRQWSEIQSSLKPVARSEVQRKLANIEEVIKHAQA